MQNNRGEKSRHNVFSRFILDRSTGLLTQLKRILIVLVCISGFFVALLMIGFNDVIVFDPLLDEMRCQERISELVGVEPTDFTSCVSHAETVWLMKSRVLHKQEHQAMSFR